MTQETLGIAHLTRNWVNKMSRYQRSESFLTKVEKLIPLGSQTFSKSRTQYPVGISPFFIDRAKGSKIWDIDGNRYIDLVSALASITLGYSDKQVNSSIKKQLKKGVGFSLPGVLEYEVSELLVELVPCAEMVRFGKNGSDATSAAVRIARAFTQRDHIAVCGYHGWQDWYIGATSRNKGVPKAVQELTHQFSFNDLESLQKRFDEFPNKIAAVILEPMNSAYPKDDFLEGVKRICNANGAILIFDETITGFRYSKGGAQELFGVIPDLATFGKGIANGFPISAVVGRRDLMMEMEQIFFSGTFGGELLSLAAAKSVLKRHLDGSVTQKLNLIGTDLNNRVEKLILDTGMDGILNLSGHPTWKFLNWREVNGFDVATLKTFFMQEMFEKGILILATHNVTLAHSESDITQIAKVYSEVLGNMKSSINDGTLKNKLKVEPLQPLFKVR